MSCLTLRCLDALLSWEELPSMVKAMPTIMDQIFRLLRVTGTSSGGNDQAHVLQSRDAGPP